MSEKVYITPGLKEPEFVISPMGAVNDRGIKIKRRAIKFQPNHQGQGQYKTADVEEQKFLENHPMFKQLKMVVIAEASEAPTLEEEADIPADENTKPALAKKKKK